MKYNCKNPSCKQPINTEVGFCPRCRKIIDDHYIKAFKLYLTERFLFQEAYSNNCPFKIVETQNLKHGIHVLDYSPEFLKLFNCDQIGELSFEDIIAAITKLKEKDYKLYESLKMLWGKNIESYNCHHSTIYRRIKKAIRFLLADTGLFKTY